MASPLATLITGQHPADAEPLATGPEGVLDWGWFRHRVQCRENHLATLPPGPVAIHQPEPCEFLSWLWAAWRSARVAVVSASGFRDLPSALMAPLSDGSCATVFDPAALPAELPGDTALVLFTSGSSGSPQAVPKSLAQLDSELALIDHLWGNQEQNTLVVNMVSHHHMFGLPFGLLWPLTRGALFHSRTVHHPLALERLARQQHLALVCSPVHLRHLPDNLDPDSVHNRISRVFSAGAPLAENDAIRCLELFGTSITEIYGSTETGAVAWRRHPSAIWQCLPGITVDHPPAASHEQSDQLRIHSPALAHDRPLTTADAGQILSSTTFTLAGRIDRITKIGGKRIALSTLESSLTSHPWVQEARLVPLAERKGRLGAVIRLTAEGNAALIDRGRQAVNGLLRDHIAGPVDPVALPRYWRYVARMPLNSQGKTTVDTLTELFISERQSRFPILLESEELVAGTHCRLHLHIPDNLFYFNGHFPGNPVLPGVVQTHWAIHYARQHFTGLDTFTGLEAIKFQHIIHPGALVSLELQWQPERTRLHFSYSSARGRHASGRVLFSCEKSHGI